MDDQLQERRRDLARKCRELCERGVLSTDDRNFALEVARLLEDGKVLGNERLLRITNLVLESSGIPGFKGIVDLRSHGECGRERLAQSPLDAPDERVAQELARLSGELDRLDYGSDAYEKACQRINEIGEYLCQNGGSERMDLVCYRVYFVHGHSRHLRRNWDGVCGWMD